MPTPNDSQGLRGHIWILLVLGLEYCGLDHYCWCPRDLRIPVISNRGIILYDGLDWFWQRRLEKVCLLTQNMSFTVNSSPPGKKMAAILADDIFKRIFLNENVRILIKISLGFVPNGLIDNNRALVQVMAWRRAGDKPLPEPMLI